jgi:predicted aminopeptidase
LKRTLRRILAALSLLPALLEEGCFSAHYIAQQAVGQLHLLRIRRHVDAVLDDPATPQLVRERLQLAMAARQFGIDELGMSGGAEFTRYVDTGGPVAYNLTAAEPTALRLRRWRFPLVGTVPYLGFFEREDALAVTRRLEKAGYDTYLRPVQGYSTLGYFISPIYAAMLEPTEPGAKGDVRTVEVVLHEMAHSTAYIKSASELNESFATLVGIEGAARFFRQRGDGEGSQLVRKLADEQEQQHRVFSSWFEPARKEAEAFYETARRERWSRPQIMRQREELFRRIQASYLRAFPKGPHYRRLAQGPINNALLLSFGVYHQASDVQQVLLGSVGGDLRSFIDLYKQAQRRSDGAQWLETRADEHRRPSS